ncbi:MAG: family 10 glycosylhydrolase [Acidobacteria bacterium]|nr:family 10 glycosylhydrolase [Acidobacteriota bacterium]
MRLISLIFYLALASFAGEVRGVWVARDSLTTPETLKQTIERLAEANFNAVFVNVWSRGYPLWPSKVFERETGLTIDPEFRGRDVMAECLQYATPLGLVCIPWVEYGFVAGYSGYYPGASRKGPVFDRHPEWLAKTKAGVDAFPVSGTKENFYWLAHTNPEAQAWLIDLMVELATNYKIDSIEFDRARYPQLDCGYDDVTRAIYARENDGKEPPSNVEDRPWKLWRARKLNEFIKTLSQKVKAVDWRITLTNAPITCPYGLETFAQDYPAWLKESSVDFISPQIYRADLATYIRELDNNLKYLPDSSRLVPGIDITNSKNPEVLVQMIEASRARSLPGVVIWYYSGLVSTGALEKLKETIFAEKASLPWRSSQLQ